MSHRGGQSKAMTRTYTSSVPPIPFVAKKLVSSEMYKEDFRKKDAQKHETLQGKHGHSTITQLSNSLCGVSFFTRNLRVVMKCSHTGGNTAYSPAKRTQVHIKQIDELSGEKWLFVRGARTFSVFLLFGSCSGLNDHRETEGQGTAGTWLPERACFWLFVEPLEIS